MYGALPSRPRLGLVPLPNSPISTLDDGLIVAIFSYLKPNHLRFTGTESEQDDAKGYRCGSDCRQSELVTYVSIVELIRCSMVCRQWHRCAQLRALWEEADLSRFSRAVNDDLVLRLAQKAGRRVSALRAAPREARWARHARGRPLSCPGDAVAHGARVR